MNNPYRITLPAVVSFSGGRTSGFMLRHILDAHEGQPEDLHVCFQNTGLEHPATYDFVRDVSDRWGVNITWLEYRVNEESQHDFAVVDYDTASRNGEPFTALIQKKRYLPNPVARLCTANLKMGVLSRFLATDPAFADGYTNAVGLRADEPHRVARMEKDDGNVDTACPVARAGHTERDVLDFWRSCDFDLALPLVGNTASNCVGCFLKGRGTLQDLMVSMPEHFDWWIDAEANTETSSETGARFRSDRPSYAAMMEQVRSQGILFTTDDEDTIPCFCTD